MKVIGPILSAAALGLLCSLLSALCSLLYALCSLLSSLFSILYALCSLLSTLYSLLSAVLFAVCSLLFHSHTRTLGLISFVTYVYFTELTPFLLNKYGVCYIVNSSVTVVLQ
jgi:hypothetical protein